MPVDLIAFTADRRVQGAIPLADDRLSDMLNSVARVVVRGATIEDLVEGGPPETADITIPIDAIVAVVVTGRRGIQTRRRKTDHHAVRIGVVRYVVSGLLHLPPGARIDRRSSSPAVVLSGRERLVPLTDATITYDRAGSTVAEAVETILVNRTQATWIEIDDGSEAIADEQLPERPQVYHAVMAKDLTDPR